jgi:hypothetical protein
VKQEDAVGVFCFHTPPASEKGAEAGNALARDPANGEKEEKVDGAAAAEPDVVIDWSEEVEKADYFENLPLGELPKPKPRDEKVEAAKLAAAFESLQLLDDWQASIQSRLDHLIQVFEEIFVRTTVPDWQRFFRGAWSDRAAFIKAISRYRRTAFRAYMLDELGAFDDSGSARIRHQLNHCRELLRGLGLPLLTIDPDEIDGWADYDPPRASDPLIKGEVVWPEFRRGRKKRQDSNGVRSSEEEGRT